MNNFCSTLYFIFEHYISQHCELYLYVSQRQLTMINKQRYRDMPANIGWLLDGSAASSAQAWANKFLAGRSKDKLDSLYYSTSEKTENFLLFELVRIYRASAVNEEGHSASLFGFNLDMVRPRLLCHNLSKKISSPYSSFRLTKALYFF
jgi:hypothetical protein